MSAKDTFSKVFFQQALLTILFHSKKPVTFNYATGFHYL